MHRFYVVAFCFLAIPLVHLVSTLRVPRGQTQVDCGSHQIAAR
jgi:hypothetical protein